MSTKRKLLRQVKRNNGTLDHKKVIARRLGCTTKDLKIRMDRREKNLAELKEDNNNGKE